MDWTSLHDLLLLKDKEIQGLDQLRKDHLEKIEKLQKYQNELEKQIRSLQEQNKQLREDLLAERWNAPDRTRPK